MKNFYALVACALLLSACGKDDSNVASAGLAIDDGSQISVPADALASDYSCEQIGTYTLNGYAQTEVMASANGVDYSWKENGSTVVYDTDNAKTYRALYKTRSERISEKERNSFIEATEWYLQSDNAWKKVSRTIERTYVTEGNIRRTLLNKVNGETKPHYWTMESQDINDQEYKTIARHTLPSIFNEDSRNYSSVVETCHYKNR